MGKNTLKIKHHLSIRPFSFCQEQKVRQVSQEDLDVQVLTVQKETEEILVSEACQGLQVNPDIALVIYAFRVVTLRCSRRTPDFWTQLG